MAKTVVYDGGYLAVDLHDPEDGSLIAQDIEQGQEVEVPDHIYKGLVEREDWKPAESAKTKGSK